LKGSDNVKLKNWSVYGIPLNDFAAPELSKFYLQGNVYGNPKFPDGSFISTSRLLEIKDMGCCKIGVTRSESEYELYKEDVSVECEKQFPNYYDRLKLV
jgi:hypothetical protein